MYSTRYGQPCMTNIPGELGREIFRQILNSPKPDDEAMRAEAVRLEKEMLKTRGLVPYDEAEEGTESREVTE